MTDLSRIPGFSTLSPQAQALVRDLSARAPELAALDGAPGLSTADVDRFLDRAAQPPHRDEARRFIAAHLGELGPAPAPPRTTGAGRITAGTIEEELARMSVREKAALVVMEYGDWSHPPRSGGIIVSSPHLSAMTAPQLARTVADEEERRGAPLLVAADQEGGRVNRLRRLPGFEEVHFASPGEMQAMSPEAIRGEGNRTGRGLAAAGVNVLLGPVLDVADPATLMARQERAFGDDPAEVSARAQAYVDGLREANPRLAVIAKHFPGYNVRGNSDLTPVTDRSSRAELEARMRPFFEVEGLDGVMLSSITYPALDDQPACFSRRVVDLVRAHHPDAVVMTDDLYARGLMPDDLRAFLRHRELTTVRQRNAAEQEELGRILRSWPQLQSPDYRRAMAGRLEEQLMHNAERAFLAGADLLLIMDAGAARLIHRRLEELAVSSPEAARALDESARRVLRLRAGLRPGPGEA